MNNFRKLFARLLGDERGLTAVEYAVLGAIVVAAIGGASGAFKKNLSSAFDNLVPAGAAAAGTP